MSISKPQPEPKPDFVPPFCPNQHCPFHLPQETPWPWKRNGFYHRRSDDKRFQAFACLHCSRRFSSRTFCFDYWLRLRGITPRIGSLAANGAGLRQSARVLKVSHATVGRHLARLGRHCLLFQRHKSRRLRIREPVVVDGFETFEYSQFFPFHINVAAGQNSWFFYDFTDSPLRRKGRMTKAQKRRRSELEEQWGRPDPKAVETGMARLVRSLLDRTAEGSVLELESDEHPAYRRALRRIRRESPGLPQVEHRVTSSREARTFANPLFAANLTDLLLRHSHAAHRRETIAFCKRRQGALERTASFLVWRNWIKRRRENGDERTAAMEVRLARRPWSWRRVLGRRIFPERVGLEDWRKEYYESRVHTQVMGTREMRHQLRYAF